MNRNLPAVTRETQRQLRTSGNKKLSIFLTLPFTLAGGAAVLTAELLCRRCCCSAFTSVHAYRLDWEGKGNGWSAVFSTSAHSTASSVPRATRNQPASHSDHRVLSRLLPFRCFGVPTVLPKKPSPVCCW
ncbi:hypothetical protein PBY51_010396 [Eleginops maclovinus]|uniref:Uncharacterized protein n=1 Tax=Eleginops maclovinus TaxID=56733 RepID=A0AAN7XAG2_ELEMC|nr:hypothetical protein PBY51_010396 [Eleginops maclovinus]